MKGTIKKVESLILKGNKPTQRCFAQKSEMSSGTVSDTLNKDLKLKKMLKPRVHLLLPKPIAARKTSSRKHKLKITKASSQAKINSLYYQHNISESLIEEEILALYGKNIDKFEFHTDKASSHKFKSSATYLAKKELETGMKYIPFDKIPVNRLRIFQWTIVFMLY
ncbi:hypothetical protein TNCV_2037031 [Trichonephila clavipes]|nr:hypothetical protein TNCV_2037031 [Trichonephila clavipes]